MAWGLGAAVASASARVRPPPPLLHSHRFQSPRARATSAAKEREDRNRLMVRGRNRDFRSGRPLACQARKQSGMAEEQQQATEDGRPLRLIQQAALWAAEAAYVIWLFLLPYAPGDPVWAIKSTTVNDLVGLSLNFFFILPLMNTGGLWWKTCLIGQNEFILVKLLATLIVLDCLPILLFIYPEKVKRIAGIHILEAPVLHPVAEGLFNFVIGWTLLFAPLLYTDCRRDRYKGSLDLLWGFQMFLTNTFLIPYMAIRLNDMDMKHANRKLSQLGSVMTKGSSVVGITGGVVCLVSALWTFFGRPDAAFGGITDRWEFFLTYIGSERLAYAFIWDICLYAIFQPWLIADNLQNVKENNLSIVSNLRFIPVVGLVAYSLCLEADKSVSET